MSERIADVAHRHKLQPDHLVYAGGVALGLAKGDKLVTEMDEVLPAKVTLQKLATPSENEPEEAPVQGAADTVQSSSSALSSSPGGGLYCELPNESPHYDQFVIHRAVDQLTGCGPTAWAILSAWVSQRAFDGDAIWAPLQGIMRQDGAARADFAAWPAAPQLGPAEKKMTEHIVESLGSIGTTDGTPTLPSQMADIMNYLANVGLYTSVRVDSFHHYGIHTDSMWDTAKRNICSWRTPTVLGIGDLEHYTVGEGVFTDASTGDTFLKMNMGWGGYPEWRKQGLFLVATLVPRHIETPTRSLVAFGKCADVRGGVGRPNGTPLQLYHCHGGMNQIWRLGTSGLLASRGGRCLARGGAISAYAEEVHLQDCDAQDDTQRAIPTDIQVFTKERLCLEGTASGDLVARSCSKAPLQRFTYVSGGIMRVSDGRCLTVDSANPSIATVRLDSCDGGRAKPFWFADDGTLRGYNENCVTATASGVTVEACTGADPQRIGFHGEIRSSNGRCLDVRESSTKDETPLQIHDCNGTDAQKWTYSFGQ